MKNLDKKDILAAMHNFGDAIMDIDESPYGGITGAIKLPNGEYKGFTSFFLKKEFDLKEALAELLTHIVKTMELEKKEGDN
jgi:hypothetical protein